MLHTLHLKLDTKNHKVASAILKLVLCLCINKYGILKTPVANFHHCFIYAFDGHFIHNFIFLSLTYLQIFLQTRNHLQK
jgi:hypothetical protein